MLYFFSSCRYLAAALTWAGSLRAQHEYGQVHVLDMISDIAMLLMLLQTRPHVYSTDNAVPNADVGDL